MWERKEERERERVEGIEEGREGRRERERVIFTAEYIQLLNSPVTVSDELHYLSDCEQRNSHFKHTTHSSTPPITLNTLSYQADNTWTEIHA